MASVPPSELRGYLREAEDKLKEWDDKLEKAQALLLKGMEMKSDRLMELAEERIATAKKAIAQADEDIEMYRKAVVAPPAAIASAGNLKCRIYGFPHPLSCDSCHFSPCW